MKKLLEFIDKYGRLISLLILLVLFFRTCGMNIKQENFEKEVKTEITKLDSLIKLVPTDLNKEVMENVTEDNMWNFLELEELADKKGISILELKHKAKEVKDER